MVRQSIVREKDFGRRALALNMIEGIGTLATGFIPFFKVTNTQANYSTLTSILGNQFKEGFKSAVPDLTVAQLGRLDEEINRDGLTIQHNRSERTVTFIPKGVLYYAFDNNEDRKNPGKIMAKLGDLIVVGREIVQYANREIVIPSRADQAVEDDTPVSDALSASDESAMPLEAEGVVYETGEPPKTSTQTQRIGISVNGKKLDLATLKFVGEAANFLEIIGTPSTAPTRIEATVIIKPNTPASDIYTLQVGKGQQTKEVNFKVRP
jgi:hypothetical protein